MFSQVFLTSVILSALTVSAKRALELKVSGKLFSNFLSDELKLIEMIPRS
jgi:hypothetical protein